MPAISMFYGIIIYMFFFDDKKHHRPHIHAHYSDHSAVIAIEGGEVLKNRMPTRPRVVFQRWALAPGFWCSAASGTQWRDAPLRRISGLGPCGIGASG
jgi:hypothetical protein